MSNDKKPFIRRRHLSYTMVDFHKEYSRYLRKELGREKEKVRTYQEYREIVSHFFAEMYKNLIHFDNLTFSFPYSLGKFYIKAYKPRVKHGYIDFQETRKQGITVRKFRNNAFGHYYGLTWKKMDTRAANLALYRFSATFSAASTALGIGKRGLSAFIKRMSQNPLEKPMWMKINRK